MKFILTVDTEADNQWVPGLPITTQNLRFIPQFQSLCDTFRIYPTYLVTSEICDDRFAVKLLTEYWGSGRAEIGSHLHIWSTPPFEDLDGFRYNDLYHGYANELPETMLKEKIDYLTHQFFSTFGFKPTSFRSGRFGFNETCANILMQNGYLVDSSITPYINWSKQKGLPNGTGGPNFVYEGVRPHSIRNANGSICEIPVTILPTRFPFTSSQRLTRLYSSLQTSMAGKIMRKITFGSQPVWFRPFPYTTIGMLHKVLKTAMEMNLECVTMMLHSSELMPGCSPYRRDQKDVDELLSLMEALFTLLERNTIESCTLSDVARSMR